MFLFDGGVLQSAGELCHIDMMSHTHTHTQSRPLAAGGYCLLLFGPLPVELIVFLSVTRQLITVVMLINKGFSPLRERERERVKRCVCVFPAASGSRLESVTSCPLKNTIWLYLCPQSAMTDYAIFFVSSVCYSGTVQQYSVVSIVSV